MQYCFYGQIADALEKNKAITINGQSITIPKTDEISLEYEEEGDDTELEIEFNWTKAQHAATGKPSVK